MSASTGVAAQHIGGTTLHSFAGVGLARASKEDLLTKLSSTARDRWNTVRVLVIDEISMIDSLLFDKLEFIARSVRNSSLAWGGIQLILVGDFFQLPPVALGSFGKKFCFQSSAWTQARIRRVLLREIVRQSSDPKFASVLSEIRVGKCSESSLQILRSCHESVKQIPNDGIQPTRLYCKNAAVDNENLVHLAALPGKEISFVSDDNWRVEPKSASDKKRVEDSLESKSPAILRLKKGAQVMLLKNMPELQLVNGSRGVVEGFAENGENMHHSVAVKAPLMPIVRFDNGAKLTVSHHDSFMGTRDGALVRWQYPLKLAWAVTVHKSQGMTLSRATITVDDAFAEGQVYVALSRVSSLAGLFLTGPMLKPGAVKAHPDVIAFYNRQD